MFHSATLKLTAGYLLILMAISGLFSFTIYNIAATELLDRLKDFQVQMEGPAPLPNHRFLSASRADQWQISNRNLMIQLAYINFLILVLGGAGSYLLARRSLQNIEHTHEIETRFTSYASHELRTPLAIMQSELEVALRDQKLSKADMREVLESNLEEVDRLSKLTKTLLMLTKLEHTKLDMEPLDLITITREVLETYDPTGKRIRLVTPKADTYINGNAESIQELITILVDNALKYSNPKIKITIDIKTIQRRGYFVITNKGPAIPKDKLPYIFDRFYRGDESHSSPGYGLGLSLAREIVQVHRGELSVSSNSKDTTSFQFSMPVRKSK